MERITRTELAFEILALIRRRSVCERGQNACIILRDNRIISSGYNGPLDSVCNCDTSEPCKKSVHAELNAILAAAKNGISIIGAQLICTSAPCPNCAMAILQSGITQVWYKEEFRDMSGVELLKSKGISVLHHEKTDSELHREHHSIRRTDS